jgi:hypothetical protein
VPRLAEYLLGTLLVSGHVGSSERAAVAIEKANKPHRGPHLPHFDNLFGSFLASPQASGKDGSIQQLFQGDPRFSMIAGFATYAGNEMLHCKMRTRQLSPID